MTNPTTTPITGGCYCGAIRYEITAPAMMKAQCHCRECQHNNGGSPNVFGVYPESGFRYVKGTPKTFSRSDLAQAVQREFCATCGTPILSRAPHVIPGAAIVKVGSMDDGARDFGKPDAAIFLCDVSPWHVLPEGLPRFDKMPG
jgi:hypothetical protein